MRRRLLVLLAVAGSLSLLFDDTEPLQAGLRRFVSTYLDADRENTARKLGLADYREDDTALMQQLQDLLTEGEIDMTLFFRALIDADPMDASLAAFDDAHLGDVQTRALMQRITLMRQ